MQCNKGNTSSINIAFAFEEGLVNKTEFICKGCRSLKISFSIHTIHTSPHPEVRPILGMAPRCYIHPKMVYSKQTPILCFFHPWLCSVYHWCRCRALYRRRNSCNGCNSGNSGDSGNRCNRCNSGRYKDSSSEELV